MKLKNFKPILLAISIAVLSTNCTESNDTTDSTTELSSFANLKILGQPYDYYNHATGNAKLKYFNDEKSITANSLIINEKFELIVEDLIASYNFTTTDLSKITSIAFYGHNLNFSLQKENITGFTLLKNIDGNFITETYQVKDSKAISAENLTKIHKQRIFSEVFGYISNEINEENDSFFLVNRPIEQQTIKLKNVEEEEDYSFELSLLDQYPIIYTNEAASKHYCTLTECDSEKVGFCTHVTDTEDSYCGKSSYIDDCPDEEGGTDPGPEEEDDYTFVQNARAAMYSIRDNIFSSSTKGQQYIDFYYKIGHVWKVTGTYNTNTADIQQLMDFIRRKSLYFLAAGSNDVIINTSEANYLRSKINTYKNVHSNAEYQYIFTTLDNDLNTFEGKTKADLLSIF
ncbi:hypothetical protein FUA48_08485 [Flavobacterium alkalisoli]|uniref:Uncharacterized protein n=1 Tax=Flavobacterium alkalisoli TaxID=2602769 RepID=A0A5B9FXZ4_9FLAO|nr:hypothetical protein [Flavobacterium alkalisoli]QEE49617.1 hypothetical protein FUA48_08485 [Flavobacterium alkalisoli]